MSAIVGHFTFALCVCFGLACTVYLVVHDHPWFAFFVLCLTGSIRVKTSKSESSS